MTDADYLAWLTSADRLPVILVEVVARIASTETTLYLSNIGHVTSSSDTPASITYDACIVGGVSTSESLDLNGGGSSIAFGDIEIDNRGGARDAWLGYVWANRAVQVYVGDARWPRSDFRLVFDGVVADIGSRGPEVLNLKLLDKLQRLNNPMTETTLGGATNNKDRLLPLTFGECFNVTPLQTDPATLEYQVHDGPIEDIIEVRSNGAVPVSITKHLSTGKFTLDASPNGTMITASVQGYKPSTYSNDIAGLIQAIVVHYGPSYTRFSSGDIDASNFSAFTAANPQPVGVYCADRVNVIEVCEQLASSVGAQLVVSTLGKLRLVQVTLPVSGTPTAIGKDDIEYHTLQVDERVTVVASVKVGYCKNWTVEDKGLAGGINPANVPLFEKEWLDATDQDSSVQSIYNSPRLLRSTRTRGGRVGGGTGGALDVAPPTRIETLLLTESDAQAEATRRLTLWKTPRTVYSMVGRPQLMLLELGDPVTITHDRFNLSGGVTGMVVRIERDWLQMRTTIGVLA